MIINIIIINIIIKMKFYNREEELKELDHFYRKRPSMLVITGRRRVGKTELIKKIKNQIYLFVDPEKPEHLMIQEFFNEIKSHLKIDELIKVETWEDLFRLIFKIAEKEEIVVSFDEFQRFLRINPSVIFQLQKFWDLNKEKSKIFLVFSGSSIGMIKKIFIENNAPLFKRAQNIIYLRPFKFDIVNAILSDFGLKSMEEKIQIYALFGGVINYYSLMDFYNVKSLTEIFQNLVLRKYAPLKNEVRDIFVEEFGREHKTYYSILLALSSGKNTKKEIEDVVEVKGTSLSPYLYDLIEILNIVDFVLPFNERKGSKKGRYFLKDNFFRFWFKFVFNNMSLYEKEDFTAIYGIIKKEFNSFVGYAFEDFCRELIENNKISLPFKKTTVGRWWSRRGQEIDLVVINEESKQILFAECKWQDKVDAEKILTELKEKSKYVEWNNGKRKEYFAVFAKSFGNKVKREDLLLFDLGDIKRAFS